MANTYDVGDLVRVTGTFTNAAGTPVDPTRVFVEYCDPSGNVTRLEYLIDAALVRDSQGVYHTDVNVDESWDWAYRWYATGTGQSAGEERFHVRPRQVPES